MDIYKCPKTENPEKSWEFETLVTIIEIYGLATKILIINLLL
jgi:hypothetical protein